MGAAWTADFNMPVESFIKSPRRLGALLRPAEERAPNVPLLLPLMRTAILPGIHLNPSDFRS